MSPKHKNQKPNPRNDNSTHTGKSSDAPVEGEDFEIDEDSTADSGVRTTKSTGSKNQGSSNEASQGRYPPNAPA